MRLIPYSQCSDSKGPFWNAGDCAQNRIVGVIADFNERSNLVRDQMLYLVDPSEVL
jgi:hypothetical protein